MNTKKLKFIVGGLTLAVFAAVVVFAAAPTHAQADENLDNGTEIVSTMSEASCEMSADTKDCSQECVPDKNCKQVCEPGCVTAPCTK
jgi:hypothetical protein